MVSTEHVWPNGLVEALTAFNGANQSHRCYVYVQSHTFSTYLNKSNFLSPDILLNEDKKNSELLLRIYTFHFRTFHFRTFHFRTSRCVWIHDPACFLLSYGNARSFGDLQRNAVVWNKQKLRRKYWATRSSVRSFARAAYSFTRSLNSLTPLLVGKWIFDVSKWPGFFP